MTTQEEGVVNMTEVRRVHQVRLEEERKKRQEVYRKVEALKGNYSKEDYDKLFNTPPEEWEERYDEDEKLYYLFFYKVVTDPPNILKLDIDEVDRQMLAAYRAAGEKERADMDAMLKHYNVELPQ